MSQKVLDFELEEYLSRIKLRPNSQERTDLSK